ncbi:MAG: HigA family addiction module antidote protein [Rhodospirillaceae bacterium]|jgi:HTH-type transcriptional regulator / antitoxin HigA|nr:HigA family addiction module antidote protein [Nitrospinaceae bacterium]MBT4427327.1 HigA family addiction module antidote protein [Rhodospirillaceae bacterium]MBT5039028.1 HigA family addiction module antidote protein [Rhodospirillaceae bacterium]MBT5676196.1 HigA family addiction module antidote protein [Rhodospirillaceae bacterium]MBT5778293.1 HigA family addiction module antidote protein [Rhodospirillaceae bacterium]
MTDRVPAEVFPPGEFLRDELEARNWTQTEFAEIIERPTRLVNEVIAGKRGVTPETASEFAAALGTSAQFWMNLESSYQLSKISPALERISRTANLRERFPVREMLKRGWIEGSENVEVVEQRVLNFFNVKSVEDEVRFSHAARRNHEEEISTIQLAWLFRVRQLASALSVPQYSKKLLQAALGDLEALMTEPEEIRHVPTILHEAGVRFVIVEPVPRSEIEGVCFWIDNNKAPVIGLTLRYGRIDNFWFNLRHEIEHVLNGDGKSGVIIDDTELLSGSVDQSDEERVANEAAANFCVPSQNLTDFIGRLDPMYSKKNLIGFARLMQRHPGIVVGQLQKRTGRWELFRNYQVDVRQFIVQSSLADGYGKSAPALE